MALRTGQTLEFRHFDDQLKQELTVMSRKWMTCMAMAAVVLATSVAGNSAFAEGKERGDRGRPAARGQRDRGPSRRAPEHAAPKHRAPEHAAPKHHPPGNAKRGGNYGGGPFANYFGPKNDRAPELEKVLDMILRHQDRDEDRAKLGAALKSLIDGNGSSSLGYGYHGSYRNRYGRLDINTAVNYELRRQQLLEDRKKLGDALKSLIKDASSSEKCETESVGSYSPNYCPPGYAPVVLESATPSYYRYVNCD